MIKQDEKNILQGQPRPALDKNVCEKNAGVRSVCCS